MAVADVIAELGDVDTCVRLILGFCETVAHQVDEVPAWCQIVMHFGKGAEASINEARRIAVADLIRGESC